MKNDDDFTDDNYTDIPDGEWSNLTEYSIKLARKNPKMPAWKVKNWADLKSFMFEEGAFCQARILEWE